MPRRLSSSRDEEVRGQNQEANSLREVARETARLWRKHHLSYDQSKHVVEQTRRELGLEAPRERRRTVERLDRIEVERLIEAAYVHSSRYGFMVKILFYTGARVSEFVHLRVEDLHLAHDPPQVYIAKAVLPESGVNVSHWLPPEPTKTCAAALPAAAETASVWATGRVAAPS